MPDVHRSGVDFHLGVDRLGRRLVLPQFRHFGHPPLNLRGLLRCVCAAQAIPELLRNHFAYIHVSRRYYHNETFKRDVD